MNETKSAVGQVAIKLHLNPVTLEGKDVVGGSP